MITRAQDAPSCVHSSGENVERRILPIDVPIVCRRHAFDERPPSISGSGPRQQIIYSSGSPVRNARHWHNTTLRHSGNAFNIVSSVPEDNFNSICRISPNNSTHHCLDNREVCENPHRPRPTQGLFHDCLWCTRHDCIILITGAPHFDVFSLICLSPAQSESMCTPTPPCGSFSFHTADAHLVPEVLTKLGIFVQMEWRTTSHHHRPNIT